MKKSEIAKTKVNISIIVSQDVDDFVSDNNDIGGEVCSTLKCANESVVNESLVQLEASSSIFDASQVESLNLNQIRLSASVRRAKFQGSRRTMSAPIRPTNTDEMKSKKKHSKKKKVIRVNLTMNRDKELDIDSNDESYEEIDLKKKNNVTSKISVRKAFASRSKSMAGCDQIGIETMMSILSSGSDSEKEDTAQKPMPSQKLESSSTRIRANVLRKTVSFQDDDCSSKSNKEPLNAKKIASFPGRVQGIRSTRNLFGQEICNLYLPNKEIDKSSERKILEENQFKTETSTNDEGNNVLKTSKAFKKETKANLEGASSHENQSPKEQECWRLYEKMKKTGLNISYDTILRGILKPSELRQLEKQKRLNYFENEESSTNIVEEDEQIS